MVNSLFESLMSVSLHIRTYCTYVFSYLLYIRTCVYIFAICTEVCTCIPDPPCSFMHACVPAWTLDLQLVSVFPQNYNSQE